MGAATTQIKQFINMVQLIAGRHSVNLNTVASNDLVIIRGFDNSDLIFPIFCTIQYGSGTFAAAGTIQIRKGTTVVASFTCPALVTGELHVVSLVDNVTIPATGNWNINVTVGMGGTTPIASVEFYGIKT